jgi:FlaA1/EpsC-like NDP-sugar epimerase
MRKKSVYLVRSFRRATRRFKQMLMISADLFAIPAALFTAIVLRLDTPVVLDDRLGALAAIALLSTIPVFAILGLYRAVIRFLGLHAALLIVSGVAFSTAALIAVNNGVFETPLPTEVFVIYFAIATLYVGVSRIAAREILRLHISAESVLIYGAGAAGGQLCSSLRTRGQYRAVAFVDDNPLLHGARVAGIRVESPARLLELRRQLGASIVLLAMPSTSRRRRGEIIDRVTAMGFKIQTVPEISEIIAGNSRLDEVRDIDVHDLLGRAPVPPNTGLLSACIRGKSILVTGAGGSIGSELCRQIIDLSPRRLVLLEVSELALYEIERELRSLNVRLGNRIELVALLGNAHHKHRVREIMTTFGIQTSTT